jgi:hypothetical protein
MLISRTFIASFFSFFIFFSITVCLVFYNFSFSQVHDFDVVAFLGSKLSSFAIENIEKAIGLGNGEWSHVGIVVSTHVMDIENGQPNTFYLLESNAMLGNGYAFDIERNSSINGVQIRPLADVLREPNRCTALLQLNKHPWYKQSQDTKHSIRRALTSFYKQVRHRGYDFNPFHLMKAADLQAARKLRYYYYYYSFSSYSHYTGLNLSLWIDIYINIFPFFKYSLLIFLILNFSWTFYFAVTLRLCLLAARAISRLSPKRVPHSTMRKATISPAQLLLERLKSCPKLSIARSWSR